MREVKYITTRILENSNGDKKGKIRVVVYKDEPSTAYVRYICPECGYQEETSLPWKKPLIVKCSNCGYKMKIVNLLRQFKKERKSNKQYS